MLKSVEIKKFRSCENISLKEIGNLTILIGKNGAGKSNLLKSISWPALVATNSEYIQGLSRKVYTQTGIVQLNFILNLVEYSYYLEIDFEYKDGAIKTFKETLTADGEYLIQRNSSAIKVSTMHDEITISEEISSISALMSLLNEENDLKAHLVLIYDFLKTIIYYPLLTNDNYVKPTNILSSLVHQDDYDAWKSGEKSNLSFDDLIVYKILDSFLIRGEAYTEIQELLGPKGLGILESMLVTDFDIPGLKPNLTDLSTKVSSKVYIVNFIPRNHDKNFHFSDLSFGTKRIIHFITSIIYDKSSVYLVEQIEDGIHDGLIHKLISLIRSNYDETQFLIASHSSHIFNQAHPTEVRFVELVDGITNLSQLDEDEIAAAHYYLSEEGTFSDFLEGIR